MSNMAKSTQVSIPASTTVSQRALPVNMVRKKVFVTLSPGNSVYIGGDPGVSATTGFLIGSGAVGGLPDRIELNTTGEIWLYPFSASAVTVSFLEKIA